MRPADGTILCSRAAKNSKKPRRSSSLFIGWRLTLRPRELGSDLVLALFHGLAAFGDREPDVLAEPPQCVSEVGGHPLRRVALHGLADEAHEPERHSEAEARAEQRPEQPLE